MDKALEIIMVAVILVVASVVIIAMLQGQTENFGNYTRQQTDDSSCGLAAQRLATNMDCNPPGSTQPKDTIGTGAGTIYDKYKDKCWSSTQEAANRAC